MTACVDEEKSTETDPAEGMKGPETEETSVTPSSANNVHEKDRSALQALVG